MASRHVCHMDIFLAARAVQDYTGQGAHQLQTGTQSTAETLETVSKVHKYLVTPPFPMIQCPP